MAFRKIMPLVFILFLSCATLSQLKAGGHSAPEPLKAGSCPASILVNTWRHEDRIHVALANSAKAPQSVQVAFGVETIEFEPVAGRSLTLAGHSITRLTFPVLRVKTSQGGLQDADRVTVYSDGGYVIAEGAAQKTDATNSQLTADRYLAACGDKISIHYDFTARQGLSLVFVPRAVKVQEKAFMAGRQRKGSLAPCTEKDLNALGLTEEYRNQARGKLAENFGFIIKSGQKARISLDYSVPQIADSAVVRLAGTLYEFQPDGGVGYGTGEGLLFMIYNPKTMKLSPLLELSREEETSSAKKSIGIK
jgi:hypothetical protein